MLCETVYLREKENDMSVRLVSYIHDADSDFCNKEPRDALIVLPGGGYTILAAHEGEPVALGFNFYGFNTFVLYYSIGDGERGARFPRPVQDVSMAIAHIKRNADRYHINPDRVFTCGFSAGGHLSGSIGTFWNRDWAGFEGMKKGENRPCGVILGYPATTLGEFGHEVCKNVVCGTDCPTEEQINEYSLEKQVSEDTVPHFIWQTESDDCVPVENSLLLASALIAKRVPTELHIYPKGPHGLSLANKEMDKIVPGYDMPHIAAWLKAAVEWTELI